MDGRAPLSSPQRGLPPSKRLPFLPVQPNNLDLQKDADHHLRSDRLFLMWFSVSSWKKAIAPAEQVPSRKSRIAAWLGLHISQSGVAGTKGMKGSDPAPVPLGAVGRASLRNICCDSVVTKSAPIRIPHSTRRCQNTSQTHETLPPKGGTLTAVGVASPNVRDNPSPLESRVYAETRRLLVTPPERQRRPPAVHETLHEAGRAIRVRRK